MIKTAICRGMIHDRYFSYNAFTLSEPIIEEGTLDIAIAISDHKVYIFNKISYTYDWNNPIMIKETNDGDFIKLPTILKDLGYIYDTTEIDLERQWMELSV
jgi:hypothetical protein